MDGDRAATAEAALAAAERTFYASRNRHLLFLTGVASVGFELWEQLGSELADVIVPCGYGSLVLGLARAFESLRCAWVGGAVRMRRIHVYVSHAVRGRFLSLPVRA